jgi:hypothetical protein
MCSVLSEVVAKAEDIGVQLRQPEKAQVSVKFVVDPLIA